MNYEILVNRDNPIDFDYLEKTIKPSLVSIEFTRDNEDLFNEFGITDKKIYLEKETARSWNELKIFLINKDIQFDICSGYLSLEQQQNKYNNFLKRNGEALTKNRICVPGYSEHHTGLAIDCDYFKEDDWAGICDDSNEETKYIHSILHKFGFILRYPKYKQEITKIQYEPWHIRYVGASLANKLFKEDLTLEEYYLNKLKNNHI